MTSGSPLWRPPPVQIVSTAAGLSPIAHFANIVGVVFLCGLWLPVYIVLMATAPKVKRQVVIAPGATQAQVDAAYAELNRLTAAEGRKSSRGLLLALGGAGVIAWVIGALIIWSFMMQA